jgi:hypothetical protein
MPESKIKLTSESLLISFHHCCQSGIVVVVVFGLFEPIASISVGVEAVLSLEKTDATNWLRSFGKSADGFSIFFAEDVLVFDEVTVVFDIATLGRVCGSFFSFIVDIIGMSKHKQTLRLRKQRMVANFYYVTCIYHTLD